MTRRDRDRVHALIKKEGSDMSLEEFRQEWVYGGEVLPTCGRRAGCKLCDAARIVRRADRRPKKKGK